MYVGTISVVLWVDPLGLKLASLVAIIPFGLGSTFRLVEDLLGAFRVDSLPLCVDVRFRIKHSSPCGGGNWSTEYGL